MGAIMNQANYSFFVQKDLSEHFGAEYGEFQSMIPVMFTTKVPDQAIVNEVLVGDLGSMAVFDGEVTYDDAKQSYRKQTEEVEYTLGIKTTKKLRRNDLYGIVQDQVRLLAQRVRAAREGIAAGIFNGAFSTTTTADAVSLCNATHPSDVGGSSQSNRSTSAFSPANAEAIRRRMIKFRTNRDNIQHATFPDMLLGPTNLQEKMWEFINTRGQVDTAQNNENFHKGAYKLAIWHNWLTDDNNWFFINQRQMKRFLKFYEWNPVEFFFAGEVDTLVTKHVAYMSVNVSAPDWRWLLGSEVSG